jgi:undecaprenyl-diphosphatase
VAAGVADLDQAILLSVYDADTIGGVGVVMIALTILGSGWTAFGLVPLFFHRRSRRPAIALGVVILAQSVVVWATKAAVQRVRPWKALDLHPAFGMPMDYSFPSGHAAGCFSVFAFATTLLLARWPSRARYPTVAALAAVACGIALSRVYLGAHYPSDVLAGALIGGAIGFAGARFYLAGAAG